MQNPSTAIKNKNLNAQNNFTCYSTCVCVCEREEREIYLDIKGRIQIQSVWEQDASENIQI